MKTKMIEVYDSSGNKITIPEDQISTTIIYCKCIKDFSDSRGNRVFIKEHYYKVFRFIYEDNPRPNMYPRTPAQINGSKKYNILRGEYLVAPEENWNAEWKYESHLNSGKTMRLKEAERLLYEYFIEVAKEVYDKILIQTRFDL